MYFLNRGDGWVEIITKNYSFPYAEFQDVYVIIDYKKSILLFATVDFKYSLPLDLERDLIEQLYEYTKFGDVNLNQTFRTAFETIINDLKIDGCI